LVYNSFTAHPSGFGPIALEVQAQILAYKSNNSSPLNNALIVRYKIINRTDTDINSCYLGLFADFDIGNPGDDFMGSIPNKNIMYAYNGDLNDEGGFGQNIPVMAVDMLRGPLDTLGYEVQLRHIMALENADNLQASEYYNLLSGRFADGSPAPNNGVMYAGNPSDPNGNSEQALGNAPGQRVGLASYGPFTLQSSSVNELIVAYYYVYEPGKTPVEMVQQLFSNGNTIQGLYDNCFMDAALYLMLRRPTLALFHKKQEPSQTRGGSCHYHIIKKVSRQTSSTKPPRCPQFAFLRTCPLMFPY